MLRIVLVGAAAAVALLTTSPLWGPAVAAEPEGGLQLPPNVDRAAAERGQAIMATQCGFCHGANGRGGPNGPDLMRSAMVQEDADGRALHAFLQVGRPERGMPPLPLPEAQSKDLHTFLQSQIQFTANRRLYQIGNILVGNPARGRAYFQANCVSCHSAEGDLKGVGARYDPPVLQGRIVMPREPAAFGPQPAPASPPHQQKNAIKVTVATPAGPVSGNLFRLSDFEVTLWEPSSGRLRTWKRENASTPAIRLVNPLQGHIDQLRKWTDTDMHNVTAYLASLK